MKTLKQINYIFNRKQKIHLIAIAIIIVIGSLLETIGVTVIIPFVNAIMYPEKMQKNQYVQWLYQFLGLKNNQQLIVSLALLMIIIYIFKNIYMMIMYNLQYRFVYNNQRKLATKMIHCYMDEPYNFHLSHNSAELIHNLVVDVDTFFVTILNTIMFCTEFAVSFVLLVLLIVTDKTITIVVGAFGAIFIALFLKKFQKKTTELGKKRRYHEIRTTQWAQQAFGGIKQTKIVKREDYFLQNYDYDYKQFAESRRKAATYGAIPKPMMETVSVIALLGVISGKIMMGVDAEYFVPTLSVFALAVFRIMPSISKLLAYLNTIVFDKSSINALYHDMKSLEEVQKKQSNEKKDAVLATDYQFNKEISFQNIYFKYQNTDRYVLENAEIVIPKNKSIALIGPSGAGKTTLADIILGILPIENGMIRIDDQNIQGASINWNGMIGYIPQSIYLMDDTIRKNVAYAIDEKNIDENKVWKALEEAQLKEYVEGLDEGLDTYIGEGGIRLSGGQRQRIGIARVLYDDPEILVFDEATSALDTDTEAAVMEAIDNLNGKKTMIIIAHRLTTIKNCDYVYEVKNKKVSLMEE